MNSRTTVWKTIRLLGVSLALVLLLVFATGVVSDWNHHSPSDDANCPYCHLGHQTPAQLSRRAVGVIAEAGRIPAVGGRFCSGYGPRLFPDLPSRTSRCLRSPCWIIHRLLAPRRVARTPCNLFFPVSALSAHWAATKRRRNDTHSS